MSSKSFARLASVTASTQRMSAVVNGLSGEFAINIATLKCLPLDPVSPEIAQSAGLGNWHELKQTMVAGGLDIVEGDQLIVGTGTAYKIRAVGEWFWSPDELDTLQLIVEQSK